MLVVPSFRENAPDTIVVGELIVTTPPRRVQGEREDEFAVMEILERAGEPTLVGVDDIGVVHIERVPHP
jgi:hypothetical protein